MYCKCPQPKKVTSGAAGKTFEVCSKNQGGCGHEIIHPTTMNVDIQINLSTGEFKIHPLTDPVKEAVKRMVNNPANIVHPRDLELCDDCEGGGMVTRLYPSGHTEITCPTCGGDGVI